MSAVAALARVNAWSRAANRDHRPGHGCAPGHELPRIGRKQTTARMRKSSPKSDWSVTIQ